jgi:hypothetical protein
MSPRYSGVYMSERVSGRQEAVDLAGRRRTLVPMAVRWPGPKLRVILGGNLCLQ